MICWTQGSRVVIITAAIPACIVLKSSEIDRSSKPPLARGRYSYNGSAGLARFDQRFKYLAVRESRIFSIHEKGNWEMVICQMMRNHTSIL